MSRISDEELEKSIFDTQSITDESDEIIKVFLDNSWIPATATYNYMMKDPLLDWLKYHYDTFLHRNKQYRNAVNKSIKESKSKYNFTSYIMRQGVIFETKVMKLITKKFEKERIAEIHGELDPRNPEKIKETLDAMKRGVPIIHSGVLYNPENKTFGIPDLLVRSDWLKFLIKESQLSPRLETKKARKLGGKWHYRVIDIKFTALLLRADAIHILNSDSFPAYKAQLLVYNWALGYMQGYTPDQVYILGRRWKYTSKGETYTNNYCFDKLGVIDYKTCDHGYIDQTKRALEWIREVNSNEAAEWNITNYPLHRWELYPNMCNTYDYPWHAVKQQLAEECKELTHLWMIGPKNRSIALEAGIYKWTDKRCTPEKLGITGKKISHILSQIIKINQSDNCKIAPDYITNNIGAWKYKDEIEFFVDFETCNGAVSAIKRLPLANTDNMIFMIGVGYIDPDTEQWIYKDFTVDRLIPSEEARICEEFSDFIRRTAKKYGVKQPRCIHWASAENIMWNDAVDKHYPISDTWKSWMWDWLDLLVVFKEEPIVLNGCMSFGLKDIATVMKCHGFIQSSWETNSHCVDGQSAMIAARKAHDIARKSNGSMKTVPIMKQIIVYNKIDVRVLYEIITYLRENHIDESDSFSETDDSSNESINIISSKKRKYQQIETTGSGENSNSIPKKRKNRNDNRFPLILENKRKRNISSEFNQKEKSDNKKRKIASQKQLQEITSMLNEMNNNGQSIQPAITSETRKVSRYNLRPRKKKST